MLFNIRFQHDLPLHLGIITLKKIQGVVNNSIQRDAYGVFRLASAIDLNVIHQQTGTKIVKDRCVKYTPYRLLRVFIHAQYYSKLKLIFTKYTLDTQDRM
jgi:hypothetical protein